MHDDIFPVLLWMATGGTGLVIGLASVALTKRRMTASSEPSPAEQRESSLSVH